MTGPSSQTHPALNLVASDLFFGLGAVMLAVVAALSLGLQQMVTRIADDRAGRPEDTRQAALSLTAATGLTVLLADREGLHRMDGGSASLIALDDLWQSGQLAGWLAEDPLLIIAESGQETAFLAFSRAAGLHPAPLATVRLTQECRELRRTGDSYHCQP